MRIPEEKYPVLFFQIASISSCYNMHAFFTESIPGGDRIRNKIILTLKLFFSIIKQESEQGREEKNLMHL